MDNERLKFAQVIAAGGLVLAFTALDSLATQNIHDNLYVWAVIATSVPIPFLALSAFLPLLPLDRLRFPKLIWWSVVTGAIVGVCIEALSRGILLQRTVPYLLYVVIASVVIALVIFVIALTPKDASKPAPADQPPAPIA